MRNGATANNLKLLLKVLEVRLTCFKLFLLLFQEDFKSLTAAVFVIKPERFWEKHKSSVTGKYSYEVQTIQLDQLTRTIDVNQIIGEFGGQLNYNHAEWLEIRKVRVDWKL